MGWPRLTWGARSTGGTGARTVALSVTELPAESLTTTEETPLLAAPSSFEAMARRLKTVVADD